MNKLFFLFTCFIMAGTTALNAQTCNAAFGWQANSNGNNLLNVDFTNNSTSSANPGSNTYTTSTINYGDGSAVYNFNATSSHNYASAGSYTVTVTIHTYDSSSSGVTNICNDTETGVVTVSNSPCATSIITQSNGNGSYTFTANNPAGTSGMTYAWNFGDGTPSGSGSPVNHTYNSGGNFNVTLTATGGGCTYTNTITLTSSVMPVFNCSSATADFGFNVTNSLVNFANTSSGNQGNYDIVNTSTWNFGDGTPTATTWSGNITHGYSAIGTYVVTMTNEWIDSMTSQVVCSKTVTHNVTITTMSPPPANEISGYIWGDTINNNNPNSSDIKVWLIAHDTVANTLIAVDSQIVSYAYTFQNVSPGYYLVKANVENQTPGQQGWLPTYHYSSLYWTGADPINYTSGISTGNNISIQSGTALAGPGFVGGNISAGAGKGTGTGIPGILIFLRDNNNKVISSTYTDDEGDYSFTSLPVGTYSIYPEAINYTTTPYVTINVTTAQPHVAAIDFEQTSDEIKPKAVTGIANITAKDGLKIYPNPAKNTVTIENQNGLCNQVRILNAVGQLIKETNLKTGANKVDVAAMNAGIYYLLISGKDGSRSMKFVKE